MSVGKIHYHQNPQLFENLGDGKFREVTREVGLGAFQLGGRGGACCDYNNDGGLDVAITNIDSPSVLLCNEGGSTAGHWLQVRTVGTKSNRDGIGAWVKVVAGDLTQYERVRAGGNWLSGNDIRLHFGLGPRQEADLVEINWPSGKADRLTHVSANQVLVVREGEGQIPSPYRPFKNRGKPNTEITETLSVLCVQALEAQRTRRSPFWSRPLGRAVRPVKLPPKGQRGEAEYVH